MTVLTKKAKEIRTEKTRKKQSDRKRVVFKLKTEPHSKVYVSGTFNNWSTTKSKLKEKDNNGGYSLQMLLPKGKYEYKFIINDVWTMDPKCQDWVPNNLGSLNSVITVN